MQNMQKKSKKMHEYAKKITENMQEICRICISGIFANLHIYIYIYIYPHFAIGPIAWRN